MRWPADLCEHVIGRLHVASLSPRRAALRNYLELLLGDLYRDLINDSAVHPSFLQMGQECLAFYGIGHVNVNETVTGTLSAEIINDGWEFYAARVAVPNGPSGEHRKCLDGGDFGLVEELANDLYRMYRNGSIQVAHANLKIFGAARLYLTYAALSHHTGLPIVDIPEAIRAGRLYRPKTRYERVWQAYEDGWQVLEESHRMIEPGEETDVPRLWT